MSQLVSPCQGFENPTLRIQWLTPLATTCRPCRDSNRATSKLALRVSVCFGLAPCRLSAAAFADLCVFARVGFRDIRKSCLTQNLVLQRLSRLDHTISSARSRPIITGESAGKTRLERFSGNGYCAVPHRRLRLAGIRTNNSPGTLQGCTVTGRGEGGGG